MLTPLAVASQKSNNITSTARGRMLKWLKSVVDEAAVRDYSNLPLWPAAQVTMPKAIYSAQKVIQRSPCMGLCT